MATWFVSYVHEDLTYRKQLESWGASGQLGPGVKIVGEEEDNRRWGDEEVKRYLRGLLQAADGLIILVGKDTHNRPWIDYELSVVQSSRCPVVAARLPGTMGGPPPSVKNVPIVKFAPAEIAAALR